MGRIIAIDHGRKRCGVAVTDPLQISVNPLGTYHPQDLIPELKEYHRREELERIVVGAPSDEYGEPSSHAKEADGFCKRLKKAFPEIPIERSDESFTSREAMGILIKSGVKKKERRDKGRIDRLSACLILERYLGIEAEE